MDLRVNAAVREALRHVYHVGVCDGISAVQNFLNLVYGIDDSALGVPPHLITGLTSQLTDSLQSLTNCHGLQITRLRSDTWTCDSQQLIFPSQTDVGVQTNLAQGVDKSTQVSPEPQISRGIQCKPSYRTVQLTAYIPPRPRVNNAVQTQVGVRHCKIQVAIRRATRDFGCQITPSSTPTVVPSTKITLPRRTSTFVPRSCSPQDEEKLKRHAGKGEDSSPVKKPRRATATVIPHKIAEPVPSEDESVQKPRVRSSGRHTFPQPRSQVHRPTPRPPTQINKTESGFRKPKSTTPRPRRPSSPVKQRRQPRPSSLGDLINKGYIKRGDYSTENPDYLQLGDAHLFAAEPGLVRRHVSKWFPFGLEVPVALQSNPVFIGCLETGFLDEEGVWALSKSLGFYIPTTGFRHWASLYWSGRSTLDQLYLGRCRSRWCRYSVTNFDTTHTCHPPPPSYKEPDNVREWKRHHSQD